MPAGGDLTHVPDHALAGIKVGRADQQQSTLGIFRRDLLQQLFCDILFDETPERGIICHGISQYGSEKVSLQENILTRDTGIDLFEHRIIFLTEKGERRDQRSGAHSGDQFEFGRLPAAVQPFSSPAP